MNKFLIIAAMAFIITGHAPLTPAQSSPLSAPSAGPITAEPAPGVCLYPENVIATMLDGYIAFVNATPIQPEAVAWPAVQLKSVERVYAEIIRTGYAGPRGFGSLEAWARAFGVTPASDACPGPDCCNAGGALRFMYVPGAISRAGWHQFGTDQLVPAIQTGCATDDCPYPDIAYHELAHIWDYRLDGALSSELDAAMGVVRKDNRRVDVDHYFGRKPAETYRPANLPPMRRHGDFPSSYFDSADPRQPAGGEHFAETVAAYFLLTQGDKYDYPVCWVDEDPRCPAGRKYEYDRYDIMAELFKAAVEAAGASD